MNSAAFFDVDDTLITVTSIFRFLEFHLAAAGRPPAEYRAVRQRLRAMGAAGAQRAELLAEYYRVFEGEEEAAVAASGRRWFAAELAAGGLFHPRAVECFRSHAAAGHRTVLVSGAFPPCLDPLAAHLGADAVLCSRPLVEDGRYTGTIGAPMIGAVKAAALRAEAAAHGIDLAVSAAYGDHVSDLPMLELVGDPAVVGDDPVLAAHAARRGWRHLVAHQRQPA
ncbi:HAD-IB family hydrolase [Streptomyces polygonati]|uniref:HAD-IB family hydrolase n=1 Tax=Streptomyces polygonati TaxID=1617087 RepID=A0ABV8HN79_9ACTN